MKIWGMIFKLLVTIVFIKFKIYKIIYYSKVEVEANIGKET